MTATVSVVIPTRNRPALLAEALASVAGQHGVCRSEVEILVINDGGTSVQHEVHGARDQGLRARLVDLPARRGLSCARNAGIAASTGQYLAFLDDDDVFLPQHLRAALDWLDSGTDLVYGDCLVSPTRVDPVGPIAAPLAFDFSFDADLLQVANIIPVHSAVLRTVRDTAVRFDPALTALEDWDMWLRLLRELGYRFQHVPRPSVVYHRIPAQRSMTGQTSAEAAGLAEFGDLLRDRWLRWPSPSAKVTRFRGWLGTMYWHAFSEFAQRRAPDFNYYLRCLHVLAEAWAGRIAEAELIERLARAVTNEEKVDVVAA